ncbi:hypothetical protein JXO52_16115 [bacterium]|nr:hypothetical protein [bacterium]
MNTFKKLAGKPLLAIFLTLLIGCSGDKGTNPPSDNEVIEDVHEVTAFQDSLDIVLDTLLGELDQETALDSLLRAALRDPAVETGGASAYGLFIEYKNGVIGGIFIDDADDPAGTVPGMADVPDRDPLLKPMTGELPTSFRTLFVNPSYWERKQYADEILALYNSRFPTLGFSRPDVLVNDEGTLDLLAELDIYGIVHIYSHGAPYKKDGEIQEVYLLTGESANDVTTAKYSADVHSGKIPVVLWHGKDHHYFVSPRFIGKYNDFSGSNTIVYGGFCFSNLGSWSAEIVGGAGAAAYIGFDWSVYTNWNAFWARSLFYYLTDKTAAAPVTINQWFGDATVSHDYWNEKDNRTVHILRTQAKSKDMALWRDVEKTHDIGVVVKIDGHYLATVVNPDETYSYEYDSEGVSYSTNGDCPGGFSGNTFTGYGSQQVGTGTISSTISAVFSGDRQMIVSISWIENYSFPTYTKTITFSGRNIPLDYSYSGTSILQIQGESAADAIVAFSVEQTAAEGLSYRLQSWSTDWDSKVWVGLSDL